MAGTPPWEWDTWRDNRDALYRTAQAGVPVRMLSPAPNRGDLAAPRQCWRRRAAGSWAAVIAATASTEG